VRHRMSFLESLHPSLRTPGGLEPNWAYFVARRDEEGERWAERYSRPENVEIMRGNTAALNLMRKNQLDAGHRKLDEVRSRLMSLEQETPDVFHVLGRWYYGALAYYRYCLDDFTGAEEALDLAHEEVRQAIELRRFLVPFAEHCYDFSVQRIRIVRNQRRWSEMWRLIEIARQAGSGERPYCVLSDGTDINLVAVQEFYSRLRPFNPEEQTALQIVFDTNLRARALRRSLAEIYALPGFVIPYL
jgi:hypothetical protein